MQELMDWLYDIVNTVLIWLLELVTAVVTWIKDLALDLFSLLFDGLYALFSMLEVPDFINASIGTAFEGFPALALYYLAQVGLAQGLIMVGGAYTFMLLRKLFTLGQW
ncbi:hypothetical protein [Aeromonas dhakensis]|uniref:hypothetical protein n=1 Tax=Aeromonas dhakensis TaxID=196024 RepID=UPI0039B73695